MFVYGRDFVSSLTAITYLYIDQYNQSLHTMPTSKLDNQIKHTTKVPAAIYDYLSFLYPHAISAIKEDSPIMVYHKPQS